MPAADVEIDLSDGPHLSYAIQWFAFLPPSCWWDMRPTSDPGCEDLTPLKRLA